MPSLKQKSTRFSSTFSLLAAIAGCVAALAVPAGALAAPTAPQLSFEPGSYDFGLQPVYETAQDTIQLRNDGAEEAWFESIQVVGSGSGNLWIDSTACWGASPLQPGESCSLSLYFSPGERAEYEARVEVASGGASFYADLSGEGASSFFTSETNPVDFGSTAVGGVGSTHRIEVVNAGNWPGGMFIAVISGGAVGSFQLLEEDCTGRLIEPAGTCSAEVRFRPISTGAKKATLSLFGENDGGNQVFLTGVGTAPESQPKPASTSDAGGSSRGTPQATVAAAPAASSAAGAATAAGQGAKARRAKVRRLRARHARMRRLRARKRARRIAQRRHRAQLRHLRRRRSH